MLQGNSNFERVKEWHNMSEIFEAPDKLTVMDVDLTQLRKTLCKEEGTELDDALADYQLAADPTGTVPKIPNDETVLNVLKEVADVLVVAQGVFVSLGVDGDKVFDLVMDNNDAKLDHAVRRDDGKLIVPPEVKADLKAKMKVALMQLIAEAK